MEYKDHLEFMTATYPMAASLMVRVVAIPIPPAPVNGVSYLPQAFASVGYDSDYEVSSKVTVYANDFSLKHGPVVLFSTPLSELIGFHSKTGRLTITASAFCANVSYYLREYNGANYGDAVVINRLSFVGKSCNPGSHFVVPGAPTLTALLQYNQAPSLSDKIREETFYSGYKYLTPDEGAALFPDWTWGSNSRVEEYIQKCWVGDVSYFNTFGGLGEWSQPFLRTLRLNAFNGKVEY